MKKGGLKDTVITLLIIAFIAGGAISFLQTKGINDAASFVNFVRGMSNKTEDCYITGTCTPDINLGSGGDLVLKLPDRLESGLDLSGLLISKDTEGYRGPEHGDPYTLESGRLSKGNALLILDELKVNEAQNIEYDRKEWKHWSSTPGRSCWDTRKEILYRDAVPGTVKFVDKDRNATEDLSKACAVGTPGVDAKGKKIVVRENSGVWLDPYSDLELTSTGDVDIDHFLPLSYVARHGGQDWSIEKKQQYANDPEILIATSAKENRTKGDKGPEKYMPKLEAYKCPYAKQWVAISYKYDISMTKGDHDVLTKTLKNCGI